MKWSFSVEKWFSLITGLVKHTLSTTKTLPSNTHTSVARYTSYSRLLQILQKCLTSRRTGDWIRIKRAMMCRESLAVLTTFTYNGKFTCNNMKNRWRGISPGSALKLHMMSRNTESCKKKKFNYRMRKSHVEKIKPYRNEWIREKITSEQNRIL